MRRTASYVLAVGLLCAGLGAPWVPAVLTGLSAGVAVWWHARVEQRAADAWFRARFDSIVSRWDDEDATP